MLTKVIERYCNILFASNRKYSMIFDFESNSCYKYAYFFCTYYILAGVSEMLLCITLYRFM